MQDIRKQFSLDWLSGSEKASSGLANSSGSSPLDEALVFYAAPILKELERVPNGEIKLHDLARTLQGEVRNFQFGDMWDVVKQLSDRSFIELADTSDPTGNYTIKPGTRTALR
jgi:hypothetical protein